MPDTHDPNATRPLVSARVLYRCTCGKDFHVALEIGGECPRCKRFVSPKVLQHEMAISTICDSSFELYSAPDSANSDNRIESQATDDCQEQGVPATQDGLAPNSFNNMNGQLVSENGEFRGLNTDDVSNQTLPLTGDTRKGNRSTAATPDVMSGKRYGHFELVSPLGRGGMGQVYRALDTSLQRYVAVKLLKSGIPQNEQDSTQGTQSPLHEIDKLLQEAITQARVAHPNIVTIYFVGKESGNPFLAMELVNGKPLNAKISDGPLPFPTIISIASQIADALKFSYELDLIHGDIKPSNILIQQDGVAKLSDFGMARNVSHDTNEAIGGTLNYLAPEILRGNKPSLQSDIYALGVTFYEMTFGHLPITFSGDHIADWINVHQSNHIVFPDPWPDHLPEAWRDMLTKMLFKNPDERYADYDSLLLDLNRIKPHSQVIARPFPRLVAAGIDWISILALAIIFQIVLSIYSLSPLMLNLLRIADLLPIAIYMVVIYFFRQSLGRSLMHIRVVNKHGHRPKGSQMLARSLFRMQFPWITVGSLVFLNIENKFLDTSLSILLILSGLFLLADLAMMVFNRQRQSIHDQMFGTKVVLDMDASS
jgi:serine/threonine protein kinase